jgi:release factor glutamine methyltransferase
MTAPADIIRTTAARLSEPLGDLALPYAERLLGHVLDCSRSELYLHNAGYRVDAQRCAAIDRIVERCRNGEPLDYILGTAFFFHREFTVTPAVLLPRPDTEVLVERVLSKERAGELLLADIGTGSGIIACTLTEKRSCWRAVAIDCSRAALQVAQQNLQSGRVSLVCADMLHSLRTGPVFDIIVSNPPYIPSGEVEHLDRSVREFEPHTALDGGSDGLDFYRKLAAGAPALLKPGGRLYSEIGFDQEQETRKIFAAAPWTGWRCTKDLAGHPRVISVTADETVFR